MRRSVRWLLLTVVTLVATVSLPSFTLGPHVGAEALPSRIQDREFWGMITSFSEPGGFFRSDNFISNETDFQQVIPELQRTTKRGGVYLGVGPDQNFTYVVALRPRVAFIIDIRRQNMLLHLLYKALVESSTDRADFLSRLFSRPQPPDVGARSSLRALFDAYDRAEPSRGLFRQNLDAVVDRLVRQHGFRLAAEDLRAIEYVYDAFYTGGPDIRYSFSRQYGWRGFPSFAELMLETDESGAERSYLATDDNFRVLRGLELNNVIVPLVGDFAGDKALRAVGQYVRQHGATVSAFYTSNVEMYLFQGDRWRSFFDNVATLPVDEGSTFIRSYFNNVGYRYPPLGATTRSVTLLGPMAATLSAFEGGDIRGYYDVIERSR